MNLLHRFRFVLLGITAVALIVATFVQLRDSEPTDPDTVQGVLGPTPGPNSDGYIRAKRSYLEGLATTEPQATTAALISFESYVPATSVQGLMERMKPTFVWVRFPAAEAAPVTVSTTVAGAVADAASDHRAVLDDEIRQLRTQLEDATGAERDELARLVAEQQTALSKVKGTCGCVFAVSVEGATVGDLKALLSQRSIKHVDVPDPVTDDLSGWELQPFVPPS